MSLSPGTKFGQYEVRELIGQGGMGEVYLGHDTQLRRDVAVKVLPEQFTSDSARLARFRREAQMLASLNHPNIATIYGMHEAPGQPACLAMEYVPGDTLAEKIRGSALGTGDSGSPLPLRQALDITQQIAHALEHAHARGVIHRDLKPANVKVTPEGNVKVLDFGLAKAYAGAVGENRPAPLPVNTDDISTRELMLRAQQPQLTSVPGTIMGTPAYMSPEQARGLELGAEDAKRSDIWALGCVLYELLTGKQAFSGATITDILVRVLEHDPDWSALPASTPPTISTLLHRCLQKEPSKRLRSAGDVALAIEDASDSGRDSAARVSERADGTTTPMTPGASPPAAAEKAAQRMIAGAVGSNGPLADARGTATRGTRTRIAIAAVLLLAIAGGVYWRYGRSDPGGSGGNASGDPISTLAVLALENTSGNPEAEYLGDGIAESLISSLSQLPNLEVKSRDSAFSFKGKQVQADVIGQQLGVRAVFKGQVKQIGDSIMVSAELIDTQTNNQIWGQQYMRKATDIFALQQEIARDISDKLRLKLTGADQQKLAKRGTENTEAYQAYIKGRFWWNKRSEEGFIKAIEYFQQAIEKDPTYAIAYGGLADTYLLQESITVASAKEVIPKAKAAAQKALELDDSLAEAHTSLAWIALHYDRDRPIAEQEFKRALKLNPNYATAHQWYGERFLGSAGNLDQALAEVKRAQELDPLSVTITRVVGRMLALARQYDAAIVEDKKAIELDPESALPHRDLGLAYLGKGMYDEAILELEEAVQLSDGSIQTLGALGYGYGVAGKRADALKILGRMNDLSKKEYVQPYWVAVVYSGLGDKDRAFAWLEKAYEERSSSITLMKVQPFFDSLRNDPRYHDLLRRMNLE